MVNGDNKTKQIYKINISYLDFALQKKKKNLILKIALKYKKPKLNTYRNLMKKKTKKTELVARPNLLLSVFYL